MMDFGEQKHTILRMRCGAGEYGELLERAREYLNGEIQKKRLAGGPPEQALSLTLEVYIEGE